MLEDEKQLVEKVKDGESAAFGALYDHYMPRIYRFVLLKVSHREEAEDLTHQAFLKAYENIDKYSNEGKYVGLTFGSWLYRIARNIVIDHYRSRKGHDDAKLELQIDDFIEELASPETPIDRKVDERLEWKLVLDAMKELKEVERDIVIMRFVDDLPHEEVAKVVGKSVGATKLIQHRALKKLHDKVRKRNMKYTAAT